MVVDRDFGGIVSQLLVGKDMTPVLHCTAGPILTYVTLSDEVAVRGQQRIRRRNLRGALLVRRTVGSSL